MNALHCFVQVVDLNQKYLLLFPHGETLLYTIYLNPLVVLSQ